MIEEIEKILDKFYDGDTSLEEEELLTQFFSKGNVPVHLKKHEGMFVFFKTAQGESLKPDFEQETENVITGQSHIYNINQARNPLRYSYKIAAMLIGFVIVLAAYFLNSHFNTSDAFTEVSTKQGEQLKVTLPDGSEVVLNSNTSIRYPSTFSQMKREVFLVGEAFFEVKKDPGAPFLVYSQNSSTEVLGTSFNLKAYKEDDKIEVVLFSGKVAFSSYQKGLQEKVILVPGNEAIFNKKTNSILKVENADPNALAWKTHTLVFDGVELEKVASTMEDYFGVKIILLNPTLKKCKFKGHFKEAKLLQLLDIISYSMEASYSKSGDTYIINGSGCTENE